MLSGASLWKVAIEALLGARTPHDRLTRAEAHLRLGRSQLSPERGDALVERAALLSKLGRLASHV